MQVSNLLNYRLNTLHQIILSSQSCCQAEIVLMSKAIHPPLRLLLSVGNLAQLDVSGASQPPHLHGCVLVEPEAGSDSQAAVVLRGRQVCIAKVTREVMPGKSCFSCVHHLALPGSVSQSREPSLLPSFPCTESRRP